MSKLEKIYKRVSDAQPTIILPNGIDRIRVDYEFALMAMKEIAWEAWLKMDRDWHNNEYSIDFDEKYSRKCFEKWLESES